MLGSDASSHVADQVTLSLQGGLSERVWTSIRLLMCGSDWCMQLLLVLRAVLGCVVLWKSTLSYSMSFCCLALKINLYCLEH